MEKNIDRKKLERLLKPYGIVVKEISDSMFPYCLWHKRSNTAISGTLVFNHILFNYNCATNSIDKLFGKVVDANRLCHSYTDKPEYEYIDNPFYGAQSLEECYIKQDMLGWKEILW